MAKKATPKKTGEKKKKAAKPAAKGGTAARILSSEGVKGLKKAFGGAVLMRARDARAKNHPRWSTGNVPLDAALGGGLSYGRMHTFWGDPSSGKTYTTLKIIETSQKSCSRCLNPLDFCTCSEPRETVCALITSENDWEPEWAEHIGINLDELIMSMPDYGEKGLDVSDILLRTGEVDILVIDSLALLVPADEIKDSVSKAHVALQARIVGKGVRKMMSALIRAGEETGRIPTCIFTNQMRMKVGVIFGNPETKAAGRAPVFAACTETRCSPCRPHVSDALKVTTHADAKFKVTKNKTFPPFYTGEYSICFHPTVNKKKGDVMDETWMLSAMRRTELLEKEGNKWVCAGQEFGKLEQVVTRLESDRVFKLQVREMLLRILCPI
jgi:recombination protein RecA